MPARQPFTALCQLAARGRHAGRADLHLHTTHSDGSYTPAEVIDLARRSGLAAAANRGVEVIAGAEITSEFRGRELHLLAFFIALDDGPLNAALETIRR